MSGWLISVFTAVFVVSVLSILLPEGRLSKFVKPLISLVVIIIIIAPIVNSGGYDLQSLTTGGRDVKVDADFLEYISRSKIDAYRENCVKIAEKNSINGSEILIQYTVDDNFAINIYGVSVNLKNAVITTDEEHIVILQRLKDDIAAYLKLKETEVNIYE